MSFHVFVVAVRGELAAGVLERLAGGRGLTPSCGDGGVFTALEGVEGVGRCSDRVVDFSFEAPARPAGSTGCPLGLFRPELFQFLQRCLVCQVHFL